MKKFILSKNIIGLLGLIGLIGLIAPVKATENVTLPTVDSDEATALTITPSIFNGVVTQGTTTSQTFELKNNSHIPLPIKCYIRNFDASDEAGGVAIPEEIDGQRFSPRSWIEVVSPDFILQPQTSRQITINFNPPKDLPPGGYYGILFAEPLLPESFSSSSSLQIGGRLGSLLFLISPGDISEKGSIASVNLPRYILSNTLPDLTIRFQNEGNVHLRPSGKLQVINLLTKSQSVIDVPEFTVLPGRTRQQVIILDSLKWPGIYRADLQMVYGVNKTTAKDNSTFYYLPYKSIMSVAILLILLLIFVFPKSRQRLRRSVKVLLGSDNSG